MVDFKKVLRIKAIKRVPFFLWKLVKRYLANCSIHGVGYLVEDGRHWTERLFWLICCGLSWWGCFVMVNDVVTDFSNRLIATTIDTNYLPWRAQLPSIHICYSSTPATADYIRKTWGRIPGWQRLINTILFGYNDRLREPLDAAAFHNISEKLQVPCEQAFDTCTWNGKNVDCCKIFHPLWTTAGRCHSFNSMYTKHTKSSDAIDDETYFVQNPGETGELTVGFNTADPPNLSSIIYILSNLGLPTQTTAAENTLRNELRRGSLRLDIKQQPTYNDDTVRPIPIEKRNCRFPDERDDFRYYKIYSYDACYVEEMLKRMMESCGCVCHLYPRTPETRVCDQKGLACLSEASKTTLVLANVTCMADCDEITFEMFRMVEVDGRLGHLHVHLLPGPTKAYRRYALHNNIDLVVAVGGAVGLFVGASVLSIVELPYWLIIRAFDNDDDDGDGDGDGEDDNVEVDRVRRQND